MRASRVSLAEGRIGRIGLRGETWHTRGGEDEGCRSCNTSRACLQADLCGNHKGGEGRKRVIDNEERVICIYIVPARRNGPLIYGETSKIDSRAWVREMQFNNCAKGIL